MAKYQGNANIEVYFSIETATEEDAEEHFYKALQRFKGESAEFVRESYDIRYLGIEKISD